MSMVEVLCTNTGQLEKMSLLDTENSWSCMECGAENPNLDTVEVTCGRQGHYAVMVCANREACWERREKLEVEAQKKGRV